MRTVLFLVAGILLLCGAEGSAAATFKFSFNNLAYDGGLVRGVVSGLADDGASSATSLRVTSNPAGIGLGEYVGTPSINYFEVSGNQVSSFFFLSFGSTNAAMQCCSLALVSSEFVPPYLDQAGLSDDPNLVFVSFDSGITFTPAPIPLPASLVLLGSSLAAIVCLGLNKTSFRRA